VVGVEDDEVAFGAAYAVHVVFGLGEPFLQRLLDGAAQHLHFDDGALGAARVVPYDEQVCAAAAVFAVDASAAVDDALQEGLQQQLRAASR
jgi:hypothetical protein